MSMFSNAMKLIIKLQGIDVTVIQLDGTEQTIRAAISNYFKRPIVEEEITSNGRQYIMSSDGLLWTPKKGDKFVISPTEYYAIVDTQELVAFGNIIGYRLVLG